jgi:glycosyltransferase involved in cell wall biosynthesis
MSENEKYINVLIPYLDEWYTEFEERIEILSKAANIYLIKPKTKIEPDRISRINIKLIPIERKVSLIFLLSIFLTIKGLIIGRREKIDIIHAFDPHFGGFTGAILSKVLGRPFLLVVRANYYNGHLVQLKQRYGRLRIQEKIRLLILKKIITFTYNSANHIIVKSNFQKHEMKDWGLSESKVSVIPTGIDLNVFDCNRLSKEVIEKFKLEVLKLNDEEKCVISFIGRLQPEKGIIFLLEVINRLQPRIKDSIIVLLIGKSIPRYFEEIRKRITEYKLEETVKIITYLDHEKIPLALAVSDLLVYPAQGNTEGIPVILQEALAMGVPCIVSDFGGVEEIIENGKDGFILPQNDANAWKTKIETFVEKNDIKYNMPKESRRKISERFNRERNYNSVHNIYNYLMDRCLEEWKMK